MGYGDFLAIAGSKMQAGITNAVNASLYKHQKEVNETMAKQWSDKGVQSYYKTNYCRKEISDRDEFEIIKKALADSNITYAAVKVGGRYIVEIAEKINSNTISDFYVNNFTKEGIERYRENAEKKSNGEDFEYTSTYRDDILSNTVSGESVFDNIALQENLYLEDYHADQMQSAPPPSSWQPQREIMRELDYLGKAVMYYERVCNILAPYQSDNLDVFTDEEGKHREFRNRAAFVVKDNDGNYHVIANGQEITGEQADSVLEQYHERHSEAEDILSGKSDYGSSENIAINNAQDVIDTIYGAEKYTLSGDESVKSNNWFKETVINLNNMAAILEISEKTMPNLSLEETSFIKYLTTERAESLGIAISRNVSNISNNLSSGTSLNYVERDKLNSFLLSAGRNIDIEIGKLNKKLLSSELSAEERASISGQINNLKDEKRRIDEVKDKVKLNVEQKESLDKSSKLLDSLNNDFGKRISSQNPLTRQQILDMNAELIRRAQASGIQLVGADGKIDLKTLAGLDASQLKKMGISENTRDFMLEINAHGVKDNGIFPYMVLSGFMRIEDSLDWATFYSDMRLAKNITKHMTSVASSVYKLKYMNFEDVKDAFKSGDFNALNEKIKKEQAKKRAEKASKHKVNSKRNERFIKKQEKKLAKQIKHEKSFVGRTQNKINAAKAKIANTKLSKMLTGLSDGVKKLFVKVFGSILGGFAIAGGIVCVVLIVMSVVQALLDAPLKIIDKVYAPKDYTETCAYSLYAYMDNMQGRWIDDVGNYDSNVYDNRDLLNYGINYQSLDEYLNNFDGRLLNKDDQLYINPFIMNNGRDVSNEESLTKVTSYDGKVYSSLAANSNAYSQKNVEGADTVTYEAIEDGHTNNIKDILCMVDVEYQFQIQSFYNDEGGEFQSILGKSPAQIDAENGWNKFVGFVKWVGASLKAIWDWATNDSEALDIPDMSVYMGGTVGYEAVQTYASSLWQASHQQTIGMSVEYYDVKDNITLKSDGEDYTVEPSSFDGLITGSKQRFASNFGVCSDPVIKNFKIFEKSDDTISPYLDKNGHKYALDADYFDVNVSVNDNLVGAKKDLCLWEDMGGNESTYKKIKDSDCWEAGDPIELYHTKVYQMSDYYWCEGDDGYQNLEDAQNQAEERVKTEYDKDIADATYLLSDNAGDRNALFRYLYSEKPDFNVSYQNIKENDPSYYVYRFDEMEFSQMQDLVDWANDNLHGGVGYTYVERDGKFYLSFGGDFNNEDDLKNWAQDNMEGGVSYHYHRVPFYKYRVKATCDKEIRYRTMYERNCQGHDFKYCGGHVCYHTQGIVYSITNEQLTMSGVYESDETSPLSTNYDMAANGYNQIRGKHDPSRLTDDDKSTVSNYASAITGDSIVVDLAQGTYIGSNMGVELWIESEEWYGGKDGNYTSESSTFASAYNKIRDIFDVDSGILKADNVLPISNKKFLSYAGWDADNITAVCMKYAMDWYDLYEFDIPMEISQSGNFLAYGSVQSFDDDGQGGKSYYDNGRLQNANSKNHVIKYGDSTVDEDEWKKERKIFKVEKKEYGGDTISKDDIEKIIEGLQESEGLSQQEEETIRLALNWVGRGHYSTNHEEHAFLSKSCVSDNDITVSVTYTDENGNEREAIETLNLNENCTAASSQGFQKFLLYRAGKLSENRLMDTLSIGIRTPLAADQSNVDPCDIIMHKKVDSLDKVDIHGDVCFEITSSNTKQIKKELDDQMVLYLGKLSKAIRLKSGQVLEPNMPLTIELTEIDGVGNIFLHSGIANSYFDDDTNSNPYWVSNPDNRTVVKKFSFTDF